MTPTPAETAVSRQIEKMAYGTFKGPLKTERGPVQPTGKRFSVDFCTVAHWKNGEIVEEKLFCDLVGVLKQIGAM